jgi:hypothetical protein
VVSPKQKVYQELFRQVLPWIRNVQTHGAWRRARDRSCYLLAELVHNLYVSMFSPDFGDHDIWFLNHQAKWFVEKASPASCYLYEIICDLLADLFREVPPDLRPRLEWSGPVRSKPIETSPRHGV